MLFPSKSCSGCVTERSILAVPGRPVANQRVAEGPSPENRLDEILRRLEKLERRVAILSKAVGQASLREFDLLKQLGVATKAAERDAAELHASMTELGDVDP